MTGKAVMTKRTNNNHKLEKAILPPSTQQGIAVVSEEIASLDKQAFKLTNNQVRKAVIEALTLLESKAITCSEIFNVMSILAFQRGDGQLSDLMQTISHKIWEVENPQK